MSRTSMNRREQRLVRFLSQPQHYPHPVSGQILRRETHVSHVFLAGPFAYKLKKPVRFAFLDASTLALRKKFCLLELSLNRRLAPTIYVGMVPLVQTPQGLRLGGEGRAVEWLVKMRRLPEERMLDRLLVAHRVNRRAMEQVADRLIAFFKRAARSPTIRRYGAPEQVKVLVLDNLRECQPFVGRLLSEEDRRFIEAAYRQFLTLYEPVLKARVRAQRIIDGHGDLRCENICLWSPAGRNPERPPAAWLRQAKPRGGVEGTEPVTIFDCVEFQPAFRCGDMANDFSFLVMDLEFRGRHDLAEALVARYRKTLKDPTLDLVLPFYKCHRSLVRGKVRGLAWLQHPKTAEGRRAFHRPFCDGTQGEFTPQCCAPPVPTLGRIETLALKAFNSSLAAPVPNLSRTILGVRCTIFPPMSGPSDSERQVQRPDRGLRGFR